MKFEQGHPKYAGRAKGTPNKSTTNLKSSILSIVEKSFETIEDDLQDMETKEKVGFVLKLIEYVLPKQRETKIDFNSLSDEEIDELINRLKNPDDES
jgi:hypothetical protein